ncbi:MAG: PQQ-binding-like beta-propeller repeat protein [Phycisphaerales bacterium]|nr:MAG: PQQ-binding-like beta-propeller repeat protein [Phycisphaerales bacterium]
MTTSARQKLISDDTVRSSIGIGAVAFFLFTAPVFAQWSQWGGPNRDFTVDGKGLAKEWPADGLKELWRRDLGDGYSSIVVDDGVLYTMHRIGSDEYSVALDARTGETLWQHKNPSPFTEAMTEFGPGPHSTPLVVGQRLYTIGTNAVLHCFNKKTGAVLWKHDLIAEYNGYVFEYGYACSPIAYKNLVIVSVDRSSSSLRSGHRHHDHGSNAVHADPSMGQSLMAFDQTTGQVVWRSQDFRVDYASPILISFAGQDQIVLLMNQGIVGVCPNYGELLWHHPIVSNHGGNYATPLWLGDGLILCSSSHTKTRLIKLNNSDGKIVPQELWHSEKMAVSHGNPVRVGNCLLGSSGRGQGPALLVALDVQTGERAWVERGFDTAKFVQAGGKTIILTEDGRLVHATVTPEGLAVNSTFTITGQRFWTAPSLVGTALYVRNRTEIMALDLG